MGRWRMERYKDTKKVRQEPCGSSRTAAQKPWAGSTPSTSEQSTGQREGSRRQVKEGRGTGGGCGADPAPLHSRAEDSGFRSGWEDKKSLQGFEQKSDLSWHTSAGSSGCSADSRLKGGEGGEGTQTSSCRESGHRLSWWNQGGSNTRDRKCSYSGYTWIAESTEFVDGLGCGCKTKRCHLWQDLTTHVLGLNTWMKKVATKIGKTAKGPFCLDFILDWSWNSPKFLLLELSMITHWQTEAWWIATFPPKSFKLIWLP